MRNDCVHTALAQMTKVTRAQLRKDLPLQKEGVSYSKWKPYAQKLGLTFKEMRKPFPVTISAVKQISKDHPNGIIVRGSSPVGNHVFYVKNGVIHENGNKINNNSVLALHAIAFKD